jgi:hypothetical protein
MPPNSTESAREPGGRTAGRIHRLEEANRYIEAALARLDWLEGVILNARPDCLDASLAESLLHNMRASLCLMIRHRVSIRRTLAQAEAAGADPGIVSM